MLHEAQQRGADVNFLTRGLGLLPRSWIKAASGLQWRHPLAKRAFDLVRNRMRNQDGVIQQGVGKGLKFNSGASSAGFLLGTTEPGLQAAFKLFVAPGMTVFDVGANVGFYSVISARLVGPKGKVLAFEPLPANVQTLKHNAAMNDLSWVAPRDVALGNEDGSARFVLSSDPNWGRLASVRNPLQVTGEQEVTVAKLDSLVAANTAPLPDLMKIDVEGAEVAVLEGARNTLRKARPVLFIDLHGTNAAIDAILKELDYDARVLGEGNQSLPDAIRSAEVIAIPKERADLRDKLDAMARWRPADLA
jgi:FkbM family methyltransferase